MAKEKSQATVSDRIYVADELLVADDLTGNMKYALSVWEEIGEMSEFDIDYELEASGIKVSDAEVLSIHVRDTILERMNTMEYLNEVKAKIVGCIVSGQDLAIGSGHDVPTVNASSFFGPYLLVGCNSQIANGISHVSNCTVLCVGGDDIIRDAARSCDGNTERFFTETWQRVAAGVGRTQVQHDNGCWQKRDSRTGQFMERKSGEGPFKGVAKEPTERFIKNS